MRRRIVNCQWKSGERYVMLVEAETGQPLWWPMLYVTTQLRNAGQSVATMEAALRAIDVLLRYAHEYGIELEERILTRRFLAVYEVDALCDWTQRSMNRKGLRSTAHRADVVSPAHKYGRLSRIADYLEWLAVAVLGNRRTGDDDTAIARMVKGIRKRRPRWGRNSQRVDRALSDEQRVRLLEVDQPGPCRQSMEGPESGRTQRARGADAAVPGSCDEASCSGCRWPTSTGRRKSSPLSDEPTSPTIHGCANRAPKRYRTR